MIIELPHRPRRNRISESVRSLVRENALNVSELIMPLFVTEGTGHREAIKSMPGIDRLSTDLIIEECKAIYDLGISAVVLFPVLGDDKKDSLATESYNEKGLYSNTLRAVKEQVPDLTLITDIAMDPYSSDGHDGVVSETGEIVNDETLPILAKMAISQAKSGADIVAPSDMMDGRTGFIRTELDAAGFTQVGIMSYSVKYASAYYDPFRDALDSAPKHGDKKTYQMDPANVKEGVREVLLDIEEGADIVMVKPGLPYLDVVRAVKDVSEVPVAVYNVSGEYAMVKAAGLNGWIDYEKVVLETLLGFKRAGANMILTYHAKEAAQWFNQ